MFSLDQFERFCAASHHDMPCEISKHALREALLLLKSLDDHTLKFQSDILAKFVFHSGNAELCEVYWNIIKDKNLRPASLYAFKFWDGAGIDIHAGKIFLHLTGEKNEDTPWVVQKLLLDENITQRALKIIGCAVATQDPQIFSYDQNLLKKTKKSYFSSRIGVESNHPSILLLDNLFLDDDIDAWKDAFVDKGRSLHNIPNMVNILGLGTVAQIINGMTINQQYKRYINVKITSAHQAVDFVQRAMTLMDVNRLERAERGYDLLSSWEKHHA